MSFGWDDLEAEDAAGVADMADFINGSDRQVILADGQRGRDVQRRYWPFLATIAVPMTSPVPRLPSGWSCRIHSCRHRSEHKAA